MASAALIEWRTVGLARLRELEAVHAAATGTARGRRWGTEQLNRSLFLALMGQFQRYCRMLHDEASDVHVEQANPDQATLLRRFLTQDRKLDKGNPRPSALGSDFGSLGITLVPELKEVPGTTYALTGSSSSSISGTPSATVTKRRSGRASQQAESTPRSALTPHTAEVSTV